MNDVLLSARNLTKFYRMDHQVLEVVRGVDLEVRAGEMVAIVGPSGAGKSTLLHLLGGLDRPTQGEVVLDGQDIHRLSDSSCAQVRNEKIGFVFQFYHLISELTCVENVMLPAIVNAGLHRRSTADLRREAVEILEELGLGDRTAHRPRELSGGEQQRCAIARALINRPRLILADEPTGNLDRQTARSIFDLLAHLKTSRNVTMAMVTHDEELAAICPRKISMVDGKLLADC